MAVRAALPGFLIFFFLGASTLFAITLEELDPNREWKLKDLVISGNDHIGTSELEENLTTLPRPWYAPWRPRPAFDPAVFASDLELLSRLYRNKGYYEASITHDIEVDSADNLVTAKIMISEGAPVQLAELTVDLVDAPELQPDLDTLIPKLPLRRGKIFTVEDYQKSEQQLKTFFYDNGRALVKIERRAEVVLDVHEARVFYTLTAGPLTNFGATVVEGLKNVEQDVVFKELTYNEGDKFSGAALRNTERNLRDLDLFSQIEVAPEPSAQNPDMVPIKIRLEEKPWREIRIGIGYGTEDQLRGQIRWRNNNWLGGGRRLEVGAKASFIARELDLHFLQPHFLGAKNRLLVNIGPQQFTEPGYSLNATRLRPSFERHFSDQLTGFVAYRLEFDHLSDVSLPTQDALADFQSKGWLSALSSGVVWNKTDNLLNPTTGWILSFMAEQVGSFLGGSFDFFKLQGEVKGYYPLAEKTVFASRFRLGFAEPMHNGEEVPLFERFYAGGSNSVRGYGRSLLGPRSSSNDPIGGRSLIEGSLEFRQQFTEKIGGALFVDFGQVSLRSFDVPIGDLKFSGGLGARYATPVGPVRLDVAFPFNPPPRNRSWQINFSIGQAF